MNTTKKASRMRRSRQTRLKIRQLLANRLTVFRSNLHIYAS
ncbi:MAG: 50S ribosomal protein L18, partial [Burkholderiaceae bacterium]